MLYSHLFTETTSLKRKPPPIPIPTQQLENLQPLQIIHFPKATKLPPLLCREMVSAKK